MSKVYYTNKKAKEKERKKIDPFEKKVCGSGCGCSVEKKPAPVNQPEGTTKTSI